MVYLQSLDFVQLESKGHWTLPVSRLHNQDREVTCPKLPASDEAGDRVQGSFSLQTPLQPKDSTAPNHNYVQPHGIDFP